MSEGGKALDFASLTPVAAAEEVVEVPRWGGTIRIREPGLAGILRVQRAYSIVGDDESPDPDALAEAMVRVVAECAVDASGERMFQTNEQVDALRQRAQQDHRTMLALFGAAKRVCLLDPTEAVKSAVGESEGGPTSA